MDKLVSTHKLAFLWLAIWILAPASLHAQNVWSLQQCIDTALVHNKSLQVNRNNIHIAEQRQKEARSTLFPKVVANADYRYFPELPTQLMPMNVFNPQIPEGQFKSVQFGVPHNINANLQLALPIYNPQVYGAIQNAGTAKEISELQYRKTEQQVLFDVTTLYYNAQVISHQLEFLDSNLANTNHLLKNVQLLKKQLVAKGADVNRIELQGRQLRTQREKANENYRRVLNALKLNMGIALSERLTIDTKIEQRTSSETTSNVWDLKIIRAKNELLTNELKTLRLSRYLPTVNFIASYGATGFGYDKSPDRFLKFYSSGFAGIQLSYPLFNGTTTEKKMEQKKLEIRNNELTYQMMEEQNEMQITNTLQNRAIAQKAISDIEYQIALAKTTYRQMALLQQQGLATLTDILSADKDLREARQNYLDAVIDFLKTDLEYKRLTGNLKSH